MIDDDYRSLIRRVAEEPIEARHKSLWLPRLETALLRAQILGDPDKLPDLGKLMREAGLTAEGSVDWKLGVNFQSCPTDVEWAEIQRREPLVFRHAVEKARKTSHYPDYPGVEERDPLREEDLSVHWHVWEKPAIGAVVQRRLERGDRPRIVSGAVCDRILNKAIHENACASCNCFELSWGLGFWILDEYGADESLGTCWPVGGHGEEEGFCTGHEAPHCLRPYVGVEISPELVRPRILASFLERRKEKKVGAAK